MQVQFEVVFVEDVDVLVAVQEEEVPFLAVEELAGGAELAPDGLANGGLVDVADPEEAERV